MRIPVSIHPAHREDQARSQEVRFEAPTSSTGLGQSEGRSASSSRRHRPAGLPGPVWPRPHGYSPTHSQTAVPEHRPLRHGRSGTPVASRFNGGALLGPTRGGDGGRPHRRRLGMTPRTPAARMRSSCVNDVRWRSRSWSRDARDRVLGPRAGSSSWSSAHARPRIARVSRAATLNVINEDYIRAADVRGAARPTPREIVPNIMGP